MPHPGCDVQHMNVIHETPSKCGVASAKDKHQVGGPHDGRVVGSSSWDVTSALWVRPEACAEGQDMHIGDALPSAVCASKHNEGV